MAHLDCPPEDFAHRRKLLDILRRAKIQSGEEGDFLFDKPKEKSRPSMMELISRSVENRKKAKGAERL